MSTGTLKRERPDDSKEKSSANQQPKKGGKKKDHALTLMFNQVMFPSHGKDSFRITVSSVLEGTKIWLERKTTKEQWQNVIPDVCECGPAGVPEEALFAFLKVRCLKRLFRFMFVS
jgi:hypothetical protein